jgi:hypothetical protein
MAALASARKRLPDLVLVEAYSPVAHGEMLSNRNLATMAEKCGVTIPRLCIRYCLQLGMLPLPKTANPEHMRSNAAVDFEISDADMETLKKAEPIKNYGDASLFPVYGGKMRADGTRVARDCSHINFCSASLATKSEFSSSAITIDIHLLDPGVDRSMAERGSVSPGAVLDFNAGHQVVGSRDSESVQTIWKKCPSGGPAWLMSRQPHGGTIE